jgi:IclR family acetate operon transcriptional repressor
MQAVTGSRAIDRAAALLVEVITAERAPTISGLAAHTALPQSTASRLVAALERNGLVQRDSARGGVRPGPILVRYQARGGDHDYLMRLAATTLSLVAERSGETANLAVPSTDGVRILAQIDTRHLLGAGNWVGRDAPIHASAFGKVFAAFGVIPTPPPPLEALAPRTISDPARFRQELGRVRRRGYALAIEELEPGLAAVAAPVRDASGDVIAALALSGPTLRMPPPRLETLANLLMQQADALAMRLGQRPVSEGAA